jgi:hypothetical protein
LVLFRIILIFYYSQNKEGTIEEYLGGQSNEELTEYAKTEAQKAKNGETKPIVIYSIYL